MLQLLITSLQQPSDIGIPLPTSFYKEQEAGSQGLNNLGSQISWQFAEPGFGCRAFLLKVSPSILHHTSLGREATMSWMESWMNLQQLKTTLHTGTNAIEAIVPHSFWKVPPWVMFHNILQHFMRSLSSVMSTCESHFIKTWDDLLGHVFISLFFLHVYLSTLCWYVDIVTPEILYLCVICILLNGVVWNTKQ